MHALVMAGGKGSRMGAYVEKPLCLLEGRPLVAYVLAAVCSTPGIDGVAIAVSPHTPQTAAYVERHGIPAVSVVHTTGRGYHEDLAEAVRSAGCTGPVLTLAADLPLVTPSVLSTVMAAYKRAGTQALSVLLPAASCRSADTAPFSCNGMSVVATGVNVIDAASILLADAMTQYDLILDTPDELCNVNTPADLLVAGAALARRKQ